MKIAIVHHVNEHESDAINEARYQMVLDGVNNRFDKDAEVVTVFSTPAKTVGEFAETVKTFEGVDLVVFAPEWIFLEGAMAVHQILDNFRIPYVELERQRANDSEEEYLIVSRDSSGIWNRL